MALRKFLSIFCALFLVGAYISIPAIAQADEIHLAQESGTENENAEGGEKEAEGEGQSDPEAETGAGEGETEEAATEEEGPPWTYQMARISIVLILGFIAGMVLLYYKLIASRQKGTG